MNKTKNILDFYLRSNLHVGIAAGCLTWITLHNYGVSNIPLAIFVMASTVLSYHFIRLKRKNELDFYYQNWIDKNQKVIWLINLICAALVLVMSFQLRSMAFFVLIPSAIITFFYGSKISTKKNGPTLREITGSKIVTIVLIWALVTVIFPLLQEDFHINKTAWIIFLQRVLFVFAITIPFDIRDLHIDKKKIKTIPSVVGIKKSIRIGQFSLIFFAALEFIKPVDFRQPLLISCIAILSIFMLEKIELNNKPYLIPFWIEGIPILWLLLEIVF